MSSVHEVSALLAAQARATGSLPEALSFVSDYLHRPEVAASATDIFPCPVSHPGGLPDGVLYRCRGMIQEIQSDVSLFCASRSDFFGLQRHLRNTTTPSEAPSSPTHRTSTVSTRNDDGCDDGATPRNTDAEATYDEELLDALVLYVVPVPGNAHFYYKQGIVRGGSACEGRARHAESSCRTEADGGDTNAAQVCYDTTDAPSVVDVPGHSTPASRGCKRAQRGESHRRGLCEGDSTTHESPDSPSTVPSPSSPLRHALPETSIPANVMDAYLNLPHPSVVRALQTACIVTVPLPKMQAAQAGAALHVNDVVDFYGYLQPDTAAESCTAMDDENAEDHDEDDDAKEGDALSQGGDGRAASHAHRALQRVRQEGMARRRSDNDDDDDGETTHDADDPRRSANVRDTDADLLHFGAWHAACLSRSLVSRMVCLAHQPVQVVAVQSRRPCETSALQAADDFDQRRRHAVAYLTQGICDGDELVAEYLLLHLCARVTAHHAMTPVGDMPLLLYSPAMDCAAWSAALRPIAPVSELLLSGDLLRRAGTRVQPRHDVAHNVLRTGILQVANGSHMTVDCASLTHIASDAMTSTWADALFAAVHKQILLLEYPYQTLELPVDVGFLALVRTPANDKDGAHNTAPASSDSKTVALTAVHPIFRFALQLRWQPTGSGSATSAAGAVEAEAKASEVVQEYISAVRQLSPGFDSRRDGECGKDGALKDEEDALQHAMSEMLVRTAAELPGWHNGDALVHNNTFSVVTALVRVQAASRGRTSITLEDVQYVMQLERMRMRRNAQHE